MDERQGARSTLWLGTLRPVGQPLVPGAALLSTAVVLVLTVVVLTVASMLWDNEPIGPLSSPGHSQVLAVALVLGFTLASPVLLIAIKVTTMVLVHAAARLITRRR
jgi:hypothetical protein